MKKFSRILEESLISPTPELAGMLQDQMNREFENSLAYLQLSSYFESQSLDGFAAWAKKSSDEEHTHAQKLFDFLVAINVFPRITPQSPKISESFNSVADAVATALAREESTTQNIYNLCDAAETSNNKAVMSFLKWFIDEQVEEEKKAQDLLAKVKRAGADTAALMLVDKELAG